MKTQPIRDRIGGNWEKRPDGWWLRVEPAKVHGVAEAMLASKGRFSALVARPGAGGALRLSWHWDVSGTLLSVDTLLAAGAAAPGITDIYPGADWAERETREYYKVEFLGRAATPPLMLREGDATGVLLRDAGERP